VRVRSLASLLAAGIITAVVPMTGCSTFEKICGSGDVAVLGAQGGSWCERRQTGDRECADGEILVKVQKTGRDHCIENRYRDGWQKSVPTS
jgi:hypothetical protein